MLLRNIVQYVMKNGYFKKKTKKIMGATEFTIYKKGKDLNEAYDKAYEEAEDEHGNEQGYSGAINSADSPIEVTASFKQSGLSLNRYIENKLSICSKRDCYAICVTPSKTNTNSVKSKVEHIVSPGTKKWVLKYVAESMDTRIKSCLTKGEAVKEARKYTEKIGKRTTVTMEKVLENSSPLVANIFYKKSKDEAEGKWVFFGLAPD